MSLSLSNESSPSDQQIVRYLLGQLSGDEAERIEELSVTDDVMAQRIAAVEHDLVDAYVNGTLTGETRARFEEWYLASPLRREKVQFAESLQRARGPAPVSVPAPMRGTPRFSWGLAAAASLLLAVSGLLTFQMLRMRDDMTSAQEARTALIGRTQDLERQLAEQRTATAAAATELARLRETTGQTSTPGATPTVLATLLLAPQTRSVGPLPTLVVRHGADADTVAVDLLLEATDFPRYRAVLKDSSGTTILWRSDQLTASTAGGVSTVTVPVPARALKADTYLIQVSGIREPSRGAEPVGTYAFRIVLR
jgi:hypothetical protein